MKLKLKLKLLKILSQRLVMVKSFSCEHENCDWYYTNNKELPAHMNTHKDKFKYLCKIKSCNSGSNSKRKITEHEM